MLLTRLYGSCTERGEQKWKEGDANIVGLEHMVVLLHDICVVFLTLRLQCKVIILMFTCQELLLPSHALVSKKLCTESHLAERK